MQTEAAVCVLNETVVIVFSYRHYKSLINKALCLFVFVLGRRSKHQVQTRGL